MNHDRGDDKRGKPVIRGIIFDFDGVILDSETPIFQAWKRLYREHGQTLDKEDWVEVIGVSPEDQDPLRDLKALVGDSFDIQTARKKVNQWEMALVEEEQTLPGVKETIAAAQMANLKLGIASSSSRPWVEGHLERLGLYDHFDAVVCSGDVARSKPDPSVYELAMRRMALTASEVIVLEDSPKGMLAAKRAGMFCIVIPNSMTRDLSFQREEYQPDLMIQNLSKLPLEEFLLHSS